MQLRGYHRSKGCGVCPRKKVANCCVCDMYLRAYPYSVRIRVTYPKKKLRLYNTVQWVTASVSYAIRRISCVLKNVYIYLCIQLEPIYDLGV